MLTGDSYEHHNIKEPAILLGGAFIVDIVDHEEKELEEKEHKIQELEK
jgi:probable phosphoglycerate mutase